MHTNSGVEAYIAGREWTTATLPACPLHPAGGCGIARHGSYPRAKPCGVRVARWYCPQVVVIKWFDEDQLMAEVNALDYGLTCSIWTNDLNVALAAASRVEAGYIWINGSSSHSIGAPFGGYKKSGMGREECLEELFEFTQVKNVNVSRTR